jgi:hypothetical protein
MSQWQEELSEILAEEKSKIEASENSLSNNRQAAHKMLLNDVQNALNKAKEYLHDNSNFIIDVKYENLKTTITVETPTNFKFVYEVFPYFTERGFLLTTPFILDQMEPTFNIFLDDNKQLIEESLLSNFVKEFEMAFMNHNEKLLKQKNSHIDN